MSEHERLLRDAARSSGQPVALRGRETAQGVRSVVYALPDGGTGVAETFYDGNGFAYSKSPMRRTDPSGTVLVGSDRVAMLAEVG
jgi:hypothetical protein